MRGAIPPLTQYVFMTRCLVKHRDKTAWRVLGFRMEESVSRYEALLRMYWITSSGQPKRGGPSTSGLGDGLTIRHRKKTCVLQNVTQGLIRAVVYTAMNLPGPQKAGKFLTSWASTSWSQFIIIFKIVTVLLASTVVIYYLLFGLLGSKNLLIG